MIMRHLVSDPGGCQAVVDRQVVDVEVGRIQVHQGEGEIERGDEPVQRVPDPDYIFMLSVVSGLA